VRWRDIVITIIVLSEKMSNFCILFISYFLISNIIGLNLRSAQFGSV